MRKLLFFVLVCSAICYAQFDTATVLGTVRDASGAVVAGAKVTLTNVDTGITATATTDADGSYQFFTVKIGTYKLTAEMTGFSIAAAEGVSVAVGARQRVDLDLKVGQVSETVTVTEAARVLETDSSDRGQVIHRTQIVELPLNGRNYSDLALLTTGVRRSAYAFANPPREGAFNVNGQRSVFNNFMLDGVDNNAYGTSNQGFSNQVAQPPPDAVAEFKVVTNNMSAEYGRASGAAINASMKSGTNAFHGTAWDFLRNTSLNADGFFHPQSGKTVFQRNQFGFTFGGPIVRSRAFFFTDYEGFRERTKLVGFSSLPTAQDRARIFTVAVRNPLTGITYPAGTAIPESAVTPFALKVINELPVPNIDRRGNNLQSLRKDKNNADKMDVKLDGQISNRWTAFIRLSHRKSNIFQQPLIPGPSGGDGNGFVRVLNQQLAGGFTYLPSPNSLLEFRMGLSRTRAGKEPPGLGGPSMKAVYGITGLSEDPRLAGGLTAQEVTGFARFGRQPTNPQWQHPFVYNPKVNYSLILGRHALKAGYEYLRTHTEVQDVNPLYGRDTYAGNFSGAPLADFLFGLRNSYSLTNFFVAQMRQEMHAAYVQDDFKFSPKLTLNLGVRYEYVTPFWEDENRLTNFDPLTNSLLKAIDGSISGRALVNPDKNNFAPRVGLAYSLRKNLVIRAAYGVSFAHFNRLGGAYILPINGPQVVTALVQQSPITQAATFRPTQAGYPAGFTDPDKFNPLAANISYIPRDTRSAYVQNWFFSIQRQLPKNFVLDVGYIGNHSLNLVAIADYNQARPNGPTENTPLQARRTNQAFGPITVTWPGAFASYHALQVKVERRFKAFTSLHSFTYSKALDNVGQALEDQGTANGPNPQNFFNMDGEKGPSGFDQTFNYTSSSVLELPIGQGRRFLKNLPGWADYILGGWQVASITNIWSGFPFNLRYNPAALFQVSNITQDFRGQTGSRPNLIGNPVTPEGQRTVDNYLNSANVVIPTDRSQPFGNAGRNSVRSHDFSQTDVSIQKYFKLPREGMSLQFRAEAFNLWNRSNFTPAVGNRSSSNFGRISSTFPARQIQLALKLLF